MDDPAIASACRGDLRWRAWATSGNASRRGCSGVPGAAASSAKPFATGPSAGRVYAGLMNCRRLTTLVQPMLVLRLTPDFTAGDAKLAGQAREGVMVSPAFRRRVAVAQPGMPPGMFVAKAPADLAKERRQVGAFPAAAVPEEALVSPPGVKAGGPAVKGGDR